MQEVQRVREAVSLAEGERVAAGVLAELEPWAQQVHVAGSIRRQAPTVGDVDLVVLPGSDMLSLVRSVAALGLVGGPKHFSGAVDGLRVDLALTSLERLGAALMHWTGSRSTNVRQRVRAMSLGFTLGERGLLDGAGRLVAGATEREIYEALGLTWLEPQER